MTDRVLFMHIPKSGGTTLDAVLADCFGRKQSLTNLQFTAPAEQWRAIENINIRYVSGHLPSAAIAAQSFGTRVTILREPMALLASRISYTRAQTAGPSFPDDFIALGLRYQMYREYFSPGFDMERMIFERQLGIASYLYPYTDPCSVDAALEMLDKFDHVLDFRDLDLEIKRLIMQLDLPPPLTIGQHRSYQYEPPLEDARRLFSDFDKKFYDRAIAKFRSCGGNIDIQYNNYIEKYCRDRGLFVNHRETKSIDLGYAVGHDWHAPEAGDSGTVFRWSNGNAPTIDIPIRAAGLYSINIYLFPRNVSGLEIEITNLHDDKVTPLNAKRHDALSVYQGQFGMKDSGWIVLKFRHEPVKPNAEQTDADERKLGLVLSGVLLRRLD